VVSRGIAPALRCLLLCNTAAVLDRVHRHFEQQESSPATSNSTLPEPEQVLPDNLMDALDQAAEATSDAMKRGVPRNVAEILLPEFWDPMSGAVFSEDGDQMRFWKLGKRFSDKLVSLSSSSSVTVVQSLLPETVPCVAEQALSTVVHIFIAGMQIYSRRLAGIKSSNFLMLAILTSS
jgi:hypothetical protein